MQGLIDNPLRVRFKSGPQHKHKTGSGWAILLMVTSKSQAEEIFNKWQKLKSDKARLDFLCENSGHLMVNLDNDMSNVSFKCSPALEDTHFIRDMEEEMACFDQYFGANDGIILLFEKLGVTADEV